MTNIKLVRPEPVPEIVAIAETVLARAKDGTLRNLAVVGSLSSSNEMVTYQHADDASQLIGILELLKGQIVKSVLADPMQEG